MNSKLNFTKMAAVTLAAVLMLVSNPAKAFREQKPYKVDISFSVTAGVSPVLEDRFMDGYHDFWASDEKMYPDVEHYYADYIKDMWCSPLYSLRADVKLLRWLAVGGNISYQQINGTVYHGFQRGNSQTKRGYALYIMPEVRFDYFRTRLSTLSSSVSLGVGVYDGFKQNIYPEFQVSPISYSIGNVVYGKVGLSFGTLVNGLEFGIGVRF